MLTFNNKVPIGEYCHVTLCRARYFDTSTQDFRTADVEISGGKIAALLPPGESRAKLRVDGSGMTCVPGLVGELVVDHDDFDFVAYAYDAVKCGVTTISVMTDRPVDIVAAVRRVGIRAEIYCSVRDRFLTGSRSGLRDDTAQAIDAYRALVRTLDDGRVRISPAIKSQLFASSNLTVQLHALAKANGKRLLVNVDSGQPDHDAFNDAYGCSGTLLLRSLDVLDVHTIAIVDPTLSRHDLHLLADSGAGVGIMECSMLLNGTRPSRNLRRILCSGRGALICRRSDAATHSSGVAHVSRAFGWASLPRIDDIAHIIVDTMTHAGSVALGRPTVGRSDLSGYADFAIYDSPVSVDRAANTISDSGLLLDLIATRRPQVVAVDGHWRVQDYILMT